MIRSDLLYFYRNFQIVDVTKQCKFEWYQEPSSCKAYLEVSGASGDFTEGETIQGQTSGATATVFSSYVDGGRVYIEDISGTFQTGETIQGQSSGQTAIVDNFVEERSYPGNVIKGTFPDSIKTKDLDDSLDLEISSSGAGYVAKLLIVLPEYMFFTVIPLIKRKEQIYPSNIKLRLAVNLLDGYSDTMVGYFTHGSHVFNCYFRTWIGGLGFHYGDSCLIGIYHDDKSVNKLSIETIRVLRLII